MLGDSYNYPYMGGIVDIRNIINRFSSRKPVLGFYFPFPTKMTSWTEMFNNDNYDYVTQLYSFYVGESHVKMVFSSAPADGIILATIENDDGSPTSADMFRAGDGLVLSHQAVWPTIEYTSAFMCEYPFNSIWFPKPMYVPTITEEATVSSFMISAANLKLLYVMPLPDFYFGALPTSIKREKKEEVGTFQSRITTNYSFFLRMATTAITPEAFIDLRSIGLPDLTGKTYSVVVNANFGSMFVYSLGASYPVLPLPTPVTDPFTYMAPDNVLLFYGNSTVTYVSNATDDFRYFKVNYNGGGSAVQPNHNITISFRAENTIGDVVVTAPVEVDTSTPLDVNLSAISTSDELYITAITPLPISVTNPILDVNLSSQTVPVLMVAGDVGVYGLPGNEPVIVNISGSAVPLDVNARVQGAVLADTPVWTSSYKTASL
jgi:hypothetical protein